MHSYNKELIKSISAELGVPEERVPILVEKIAELVKPEVGKFVGRRSLMAAGLGGLLGLAVASPASAKMTITGQYIDLDGQKFYPASAGAYSVIVYKQGIKIIAEDWKGDIIAQGVAGTDDASVIQQALDQKGIILVKKDTYYLKSRLEFYSDTYVDFGYSKLVREHEDHALHADSQSNITVMNFILDGQKSTYGGYSHGIRFWSCENVHVENAEIYNMPANGIVIVHESGSEAVDPKKKYVWLINAYLHDNDLNGHMIGNMQYVFVRGVIAKDNGNNGVGVWACKDVIVDALADSNGQENVNFDEDENVVARVITLGSTDRSVYICGGSKNVTVTAVSVGAATDGILVVNASNVNLVGCAIYSPGGNGIHIYNSSKVNIVGCHIYNAGSRAIRLLAQEGTNVEHINIEGCIIDTVGTHGISCFDDGSAGTRYVIISNCQILNINTASYYPIQQLVGGGLNDYWIVVGNILKGSPNLTGANNVVGNNITI